MKNNIIAVKVEKSITEIQISLYGEVRDYTPPLNFDNYTLIKKISQENDIDHVHIIKVLGHRDFELNEKIKDFEFRIRMH